MSNFGHVDVTVKTCPIQCHKGQIIRRLSVGNLDWNSRRTLLIEMTQFQLKRQCWPIQPGTMCPGNALCHS
jgi:hypothetical protein